MSKRRFYRHLLVKLVLASAAGLYLFSFGLSGGGAWPA
jgi:hypothetical protein